MAEDVRQRLENKNGLLRDFRTNAIAGEDSKVQKHDGNLVIECFGSSGIESRFYLLRRRLSLA